MKVLPSGCYRSEISISPKNWNTTRASIKKPWRLHYRFYDPEFKDNPAFKKGKQRAVRTMNIYHTLEMRQAATRSLIAEEIHLIDQEGYNPITGITTPHPVCEEEPAEDDIVPSTTLMRALEIARKLVDIEETTRTDMKSTLKFFGMSARKLKKAEIPISEIKRKDIIRILNNCKGLQYTDQQGKIRKKIWTPNQFNHYRKYLSILFSYIELLQVLEYNPIEKIPLAELPDEEKLPRIILTSDQCKQITTHLKGKDPDFLRLINIFFPSGARRNEIMRVQGMHVDLPGQRFKVLIKKRKKKAWVWKTITDTALPYWQEVMKGCGDNEFVFSVGLLPGKNAIRPEQLTRRWKRHVKSLKGIKADFYSLKHLFTTQFVEQELEEQLMEKNAAIAAADHNSHTSEAMVVQIYDVNGEKRKHNRRKGVGQSFGS